MNTSTQTSGDRVYKAYWQDGSIDLFVGIGLAAIGIGWLVHQAALASIAPALMVPIWASFRTRWIEPRLGYVRFDAPRRSRMRRGHVALIAAGCLVFLLGVTVYLAMRQPSGADSLLRTVVPALPAVLIGLGGILSAVLFQIHRFAAYSLVCVFLGGMVALFKIGPGWSLLGGGLIAGVAGAVLLVRFFRSFPLLSNEID